MAILPHRQDRDPAAEASAPPLATRPSVMDGWSLEATLPKPEEVALIGSLVAPGTEVYLSTLPHVTLERQIDTARRIREAGLEPVPHVAARYFAGPAALGDFLCELVGEADVRAVLAIGGDLDPQRGRFGSALDVIESGLLQAHGIERVGIAGYPDGHPKIRDAELDRALDDKLAALAGAGLRAELVTQFCFRAAPILDWAARLRARHPSVPVRVGLAGPASVKALVRYALRCGVGAPIDGLGHKLSLASKLASGLSPAAIVEEIDTSPADSAAAGLTAHFFSFGGLERTARWALSAAKGDLA